MKTKHRHLIKLCSDQHSPFISGFAGDPVVRTPNLDRLAANGVVFNNHYAANPVCVPGRYSMLSGLLPREYGVPFFREVLPLETQTYMRYFSQHGYQTTCVGKMHFHGAEQMYGWMFRPMGDMQVESFRNIEGYSLEKDVAGTPEEIHARRTIDYGEYGGYNGYMLKTARVGDDQFMKFDDSVTRDAVINLKDYFTDVIDQVYQGDRPLLFEVSWKTPHCPFVSREEFYEYYKDKVGMPKKAFFPDTPTENIPPYLLNKHHADEPDGVDKSMIREARIHYWGLVEYTDRQVGVVLQALEELGLMDDVNIMYTTDHGEMVGEHGLWQKTCYYEESVRVPMILCGPELPKGKTVNANTSHLDLFPTMCDLANLPAPENVRGVSMLPLIDDEGDNERFIFSETYLPQHRENYYGNLFMVKYKHYKYIDYCDGSFQLFDLEKNPDETIDFAIDHADEPEYRDVINKCRTYINELPEPYSAADPDWQMTHRPLKPE